MSPRIHSGAVQYYFLVPTQNHPQRFCICKNNPWPDHCCAADRLSNAVPEKSVKTFGFVNKISTLHLRFKEIKSDIWFCRYRIIANPKNTWSAVVGYIDNSSKDNFLTFTHKMKIVRAYCYLYITRQDA